MKQDKLLSSYWITFSPDCPGVGVTAYSVEDAYSLLSERGSYFPERTARTQVRENVTIEDLDQNHVVPNMGPIMLRGIWYPCFNVGWNASGQNHAVNKERK